MMNRRGALVAFAASVWGAVRSSAALAILTQSDQAQAAGAASASEPKDAVIDAADERLRQDLARLAPRAYSEEGIPVFLACEDLVADGASRQSAVVLTRLNSALASDLRKSADAWQRIHPDATADDLAKLVEVLADRDFANGGAAQRK